MIRVVLDTNVFVSALLSPEGPPAGILELTLAGKLCLIISPGIIREIQQVLQYPKIVQAMKKHGVTPSEMEDAVLKILRVAVLTTGAVMAEGVSSDPTDDMVISCALEGQADFIISGDRDLTEIEEYRGIRILSPAAFMKLMEEL